MEKIFVYGTLLDPVIQLQLFGRKISPLAKASLKGWKKKTDKEYPYLVPDESAITRGSIIELSEKELVIADQWEEVPLVYKRLKLTVTVKAERDLMVWVYVFGTKDQ